MKIAIGQINVVAGQPQHNLLHIREMIDAVRHQADLIVFPEMCVGGYFLMDRYDDTDFLDELVEINELIRLYSQDIGVIWGNVKVADLRGRDGRPARFNAVFFAQDGQWVRRASGFSAGWSLKHLLPDYRVFDDSRYFMSGIELDLRHPSAYPFLEPFIFTDKAGIIHRIGLEICEDLWDEDYALHPTQMLVDAGADFIVNVSSSPWTYHKEMSRVKQIQRLAKTTAMVKLLYVNVCGMQNNGKTLMTFDGGSSLYNRTGEVLAGCNQNFTQELKVIDTEINEGEPPSDDHKLLASLICALREFDAQIFPFKPQWVIGVSGGLDSSVNAALAVLALGKQRVVGINMATGYNHSISVDNAEALCRHLDIEYRPGRIDELVDASGRMMQAYGFEELKPLVQENIQARLRGHVLGTIAAQLGGVILNNSNKIETALGYATLYGDTIGAVATLGDCTKLQIVELGRAINARFQQEIVPENLLATEDDAGIYWQFAPSAELRDHQVDPMKWGYHDELIQYLVQYPGFQVNALLASYLDGTIMAGVFGKWIRFYQLTPQKFIDDLEWVLRQMENSIYKRIQMPPIVMVSRGSFGFDYRENQMHVSKNETYLKYRQAILAMEESYV